jgi:hypothetical protein
MERVIPGAILRHKAKENEKVSTIHVDEICRHFDKFLLLNNKQFSLEAFRLHCSKLHSRLGGAAKLTEDDGKSWNEFKVKLAFAGEATLKLTHQEHVLGRWLKFLGVKEEILSNFREKHKFVYPEMPVKLEDKNRVKKSADVLNNAAKNFVTFVEDVERVHKENQEKEEKKEKDDTRMINGSSSKILDDHCSDSKFSKRGRFAVHLPTQFQEPVKVVGGGMLESDDEDLSFVDIEAKPGRSKVELLERELEKDVEALHFNIPESGIPDVDRVLEYILQV